VIPPPPDSPPPIKGTGLSPALGSTIVAIVLIVIVVIGIIGYAIAGFAYASTRVAIADKSLNAVVTSQNNLNSTFQQIDAQFNSLSSTSFDPKKARVVSDQFVNNWKAAGTTVDKDDASLAAARTHLNDQQWITVFARGMLTKEVGRIDHARTGLSSAKTIAADYVKDGEFLQAYFDVFIDLEAMQSQGTSGDYTGAKATVETMKTHVDHALQLSKAPGLPAQVHDLMADFQFIVSDFGNYFQALASNDPDVINAATAITTAHIDKIATYNFDQINVEIRAFYKPLIDRFNSEMAQATAA
jgi:type II secretory pathway pseudopilin PulG